MTNQRKLDLFGLTRLGTNLLYVNKVNGAFLASQKKNVVIFKLFLPNKKNIVKKVEIEFVSDTIEMGLINIVKYFIKGELEL